MTTPTKSDNPTTAFSIRLSVAAYKELQRRAAADNRSLANYVRTLLERQVRSDSSSGEN